MVSSGIIEKKFACKMGVGKNGVFPVKETQTGLPNPIWVTIK
ncbi:16322_t:CDS:2, partial [Gigaspora rosea]